LEGKYPARRPTSTATANAANASHSGITDIDAPSILGTAPATMALIIAEIA